MRTIAAITLLAAGLVAGVVQAHAAKRVALVVGNSAYQHVAPLRNPANDAADMSAVLDRLGFEVIEGRDLDHAAMMQTLRRFDAAVQGADVALLFYAGHALQVGGVNYLAPVDTRLERESDLYFATVSLDFVLRQMQREAKTQIVLLDACRDNPLTRSLRPTSRSTGAGTGLARPEASGEGLFIAFATEPDKVALDGDGRNSPFTAALLRNLERPGVEISHLMTDVRRDVFESTGRQQLPFSNSGLLGQFYFSEGQAAPQIADPAAERKQRELVEEIEAWKKITLSDMPAEYENFLRRFPNGTFAEQARSAIADLRRSMETASLQRPADPARIMSLDAKPPARQGYTDWLTRDEFTVHFNAMVKRSRYPSEVEGVNVAGTRFYRGKFVPYPKGVFWFYNYINMDAAEFGKKDRDFRSQGYTLLYKHSFTDQWGEAFSATWTRRK